MADTSVTPAPAANAAVLRVPSQFATIQAAVDAATAGDEIRVGPGRYCGATITKPVALRGLGGPTIVGCDDGPAFTTGATATAGRAAFGSTVGIDGAVMLPPIAGGAVVIATSRSLLIFLDEGGGMNRAYVRGG